MKSPRFEPHRLGYSAALLPAITIHLCFAFSVWEGYVDLCNPYWADCVSISKSGRKGTAYFLFKAGMIPTAVILLAYWYLCVNWLKALGSSHQRLIISLSIFASLALIIYSLALGHSGDGFRQLRRTGVVLFMFCSFICQVRVGKALLDIERYAKHGRQLLLYSAFILSVAILSLVLSTLVEDYYDKLENLFEWWLIMLLIGHLFVLSSLWKKSGFQLSGIISN